MKFNNRIAITILIVTSAISIFVTMAYGQIERLPEIIKSNEDIVNTLSYSQALCLMYMHRMDQQGLDQMDLMTVSNCEDGLGIDLSNCQDSDINYTSCAFRQLKTNATGAE